MILSLHSVALLAGLLQDPVPPGHSRHGAAFDEGPRQKARLMGGTGDLHYPVTTTSKEAQAFFDQGLGQLHGFWYFEAERSFRQAAAIDPDCAMAHWGAAFANLDDPERGRGLAATAARRKEQVTRKERLWIEALVEFFGEAPASRAAQPASQPTSRPGPADDADDDEDERDGKREPARTKVPRERYRELIRRMEAIAREFPDDIEVKALLATQIWANQEEGYEVHNHLPVDLMLDRVFAVAPMHPAHHYRIHLWDHEKSENALRSAALIGPSAPGIAHQWHMGGHIYADLDRHADAAWQQEASCRVDHAHMLRDQVMPYMTHNYGHNQDWLVRSLSHTGRVHLAVDLARNMCELPRHPRHNRLTDARSIAGYGRARLLGTLATYEMWDEIAALRGTAYLEPTTSRRVESQRLWALGQAHFACGDLAAGRACAEQLAALVDVERAARHAAADAAESKARADKRSEAEIAAAMTKALEARAPRLRKLEALVARLRAEEQLAAGDAKAALAAIESIPDADRWLKARARLLAGERDQAKTLVKEAVAKEPGRVPHLARQVLVLGECGDDAGARAALATLRPLAERADLDVPLLRRVTAVARRLGLPEDWRLPAPPPTDLGERPPLESLGPFRWQPWPANDWSLPDSDGRMRSLAEFRGRPLVVFFYLGFGCLHCVEQLNTFAPVADRYARAGIGLIAIATDAHENVASSLLAMKPEERYRFPIVADPDHRVFRDWRVFDDFEGVPLHGTFLIDGHGLVRWQDIGPEPFRDAEALLTESQRLLALPASAASPAGPSPANPAAATQTHGAPPAGRTTGGLR